MGYDTYNSNLTIGPCRGWFGRIFGHKFIARHDTSAPKPQIVQDIDRLCLVFSNERLSAYRSSLTHIYKHDICVRCGIIVLPKTPRADSIANPVVVK